MKTLGVGIDLVKNSRLKKSIKNKKFLKRIFSSKEIIISKKYKNRINFFAKRFAAKEAFVKSIGFGFRENLNFSDISIVNDKLGKPGFLITNKLKKIIKKKFKITSFNFFLSISDEKNYSVALVVFQKV
jgi:holo-[acyl-carrier protein] synthase